MPGIRLIIDYKIKEQSWVARLAAWKLGVSQVAIVIGSNIHLYNVSRENFIADRCWLKHELCHLKQFKEHGFWPFIFKYILESIRKGYYLNRFEVEARAAEQA